MRWLKYFLIALLFPVTSIAEESKIAAAFSLQGGKIYPQEALSDLLEPGPTLRTHLFGGARVKVPLIDAVGLGLDFAYADLPVKNSNTGHYQRYLWDMFFLPLGLGPLRITPGFAWVVTDTKIPELSIEEISIRPAAVISLELGVRITKNLAIIAMARAEKTANDHELINTGENLNITGAFASWLVGLEFHL